MRSEFSYDPKTRKLILSDREQIMTHGLSAILEQDQLLETIAATGWEAIESGVLWRDAGDLALNNPVTTIQALQLMLYAAQTGSTYADWLRDRDALVEDLSNSG